MSYKDSKIKSENINLNLEDSTTIELNSEHNDIEELSSLSPSPKWINNRGEEVKQVFGFNENAELVNARVAMIGFLMLILTELAFAGAPATQAIFGIN